MTQMPPPTAPGPVQNLQPHRGVLILVFGILGIPICVIFGIVAWVMGNRDLRAMREGRMDPTGEGLTKAGKICGIVGVVLNVIAIVFYIVFFVILAAAVVGGAAGGAAGGAGP